ncbi:MAG: metal ABC transporter permease [Austwickia sp.]|nr:metal ABC transporter permease [Austwickia sp.]
MAELLGYDFMVRALAAAFLVGAAAPMVGIFLVQRRLALIGDGMGHVALAGVAVGVLTGQAPVLTALVAAVLAAVVVEVVRARGRTSGDVALAIIFYGGIALGVVLLSRAGSAGTSMTSYLFGAITTTTASDLVMFATLATVVVGTTVVLRRRLFAVANDEEFARAVGLPVMALNLTLAVLTAVTVVTSMRVVGLLLVSALMIVPNAASALITRSFAGAMAVAELIGIGCGVGGVVASYWWNTPSGGTIVLLAITVFLACALGTAAHRAWSSRRHRYAETHDHVHGPGCGHEVVEHDGHLDYVHDGHRHAPHGDHYDEHDEHDEHGGAPVRRARD